MGNYSGGGEPGKYIKELGSSGRQSVNNGGNTLCNSEREYLLEEEEKLKQNKIVFLAVEKTRLGRPSPSSVTD